MKLKIKWRYPDEIEPKIHEHTFYDIDPLSIGIHYGILGFAEKDNARDRHWTYQLSHVVEVEMEED